MRMVAALVQRSWSVCAATANAASTWAAFVIAVTLESYVILKVSAEAKRAWKSKQRKTRQNSFFIVWRTVGMGKSNQNPCENTMQLVKPRSPHPSLALGAFTHLGYP